MKDALAEAESQLTRDPGAADERLLSELDTLPPLAESEFPRRSSAELRLLQAQMLGKPPPLAPKGKTEPAEALYPLDEDARCWPAVAAGAQPRALELIDATVFHTSNAKERAQLWLNSPARRLMADLDTLCALRGEPKEGWQAGACDLSQQRLLDCIGAAGSARWKELYTLIPGESLLSWEPDPDRPGLVPWALERLERPQPAGLRGAVLGWLLARVPQEPLYQIDGLRRELKEDLPVRLALALSPEAPDRGEVELAFRLEKLLLQHAAWILPSGGRVRPIQIWQLARWLHVVLLESPFFGRDLHALVLRLQALLPAPRTDAEKLPRDPLHPHLFVDHGLNPEELFLVSGALRHPGAFGKATYPWPLPLLEALLRIAQRPLHKEEREKVHLDGVLVWPGPDPKQRPLHALPVLVARWLLTRRIQMPWLATANPLTRQECVEILLEHPSKFSWMAMAWRKEGAQFVEPAALPAWRSMQGPEWIRASLGVGILGQLEECDREDFFAILQKSGGWAPSLLEQVAKSGHTWAPAALEALLALANSKTETEIRLNALYSAVQVISERLNEGARTRSLPAVREAVQPWLEQARRLASTEPFRQETALVQELRRLGL